MLNEYAILGHLKLFNAKDFLQCKIIKKTIVSYLKLMIASKIKYLECNCKVNQIIKILADFFF